MKVRYTYRTYPTPAQQAELAKVFGCVRYVYNWGLDQRIAARQRGEKINYKQSSAALTLLKKAPEYKWLKEVSCVPTQQVLRHLDAAYGNFFAGRGKFPHFKSKRDRQSAEFTASAFKYEGSVLSLAKIGPLKVRWSRSFTSKPSTVTIIKTQTGKYYVTLCLDEVLTPYALTDQSVGIDLGISHLATLSDGSTINNPRHTKKHQKRLAKASRILSRRIKGSGRWNRQRVKVARLHETIAATRKDHLDKVTTSLVRRFDIIAIEDLNVRGMIKNRKLAKHIIDTSFGQFRTMLAYKCAWRGKRLVVVDRFYPSSKTCSCCGYVIAELPLRIRQWQCPTCNTQHDRDLNAAKNILAVGQTVSAHGVTGRPANLEGLGAGCCEV
ncbi:RNA-guided endonuclease InsQ/TnpB family protein [Fibrella sp. WM1]|uniref:RNA-guided endonuclease InsQ/TnpB family protein n=1 Tax=Fibrella musci TaxID=3242485 RepID=UPI0035203424